MLARSTAASSTTTFLTISLIQGCKHRTSHPGNPLHNTTNALALVRCLGKGILLCNITISFCQGN